MRAFRSVLAVVAGFAVATAVMMLIESINGRVLYPEVGKMAEGVTDREVIRRIMASAPVGALLVVLFGWALASCVGGFVAARIGRAAPVRHGLFLGVVLTLAGVANNLMLPPPTWFGILTFAVFLPFTYAGARLSGRRNRPELAGTAAVRA